LACDLETGACTAEANVVYALAETGLGLPCGSRVAPCRNLQDAAGQLSVERPTLVMLPTNKSFIEGASLPAGAALRVLGNGVEVAPYTDTSGFTVTGGTVHFDGLNLQRQSSMHVEPGLKCTNARVSVTGATVTGFRGGIAATDCPLSVQSGRFLGNHVGLEARCSGSCSTDFPLTVERSLFEANVFALVTSVAPYSIRNNLFLRNGDGNYTRVINLGGGAGPKYFGYNTLVGNTNNCIYIGIVACGATVEVTSNVSWGNFPGFAPGSCDDQVFIGCETSMSFNLTETLYPGLENRGGLDPRFTNAAADDFTLRSDSPALDTGNPAGAPTQDYLGNQRPLGSGFDIGAFESF
jgi:hypothetical protein